MIPVSIIIPSFNSAEFLPVTLRSALAQHGAEVIVVDDGSTDRTVEVLEEFANDVKVIRQANAGVSAARNRGADLAQGEWLLFLDSDDCLLPGAVEALLRVAANENPGVVYGMVIEREEPPEKPRLSGFAYCVGDPPIPAQRNYKRSVIITPGSAIVRKSLHQQIGGFVSSFEPMEDRDYWIKCGFLASFRFADTVIVDKGWRQGSAGQQDAKRIWNGLRSRLHLPEWCKKQGVEAPGLPSERKVLVESALKEATWLNVAELYEPLLEEATRAGVSVRWTFPAYLKSLVATSGSRPKWMIKLE